MEPLEQNQVELRKNMNDMKFKVYQMLEAMLSHSKNNLQHVVTENAVSTSGFTVMTNPMHCLLPDYDPPSVNIRTQSQMIPLIDPTNERLCALEKKTRVMDVNDTHELDVIDICLVPGLVIPPKIRVPNFEKYQGNIYPRHHLVTFFQKMASHTHDDKLMIHYFQDSLIGASLSCYMKLERIHVQSWEELANAFLKKYKYNLDITPN
ncbi:unnamed protein product [Lathyrus oleraceus]